jgi:hypothetical protein
MCTPLSVSVCPISLLFRSIEFGPLLNKIFFCTPSVHLSPLSKQKPFYSKIFFILAWNLPAFIIRLLLIGYHPPTFIVSLLLIACS